MRVWNFGIKVCKVLGFGVLVLGVWVGVLDFRVQVPHIIGYVENKNSATSRPSAEPSAKVPSPEI